MHWISSWFSTRMMKLSVGYQTHNLFWIFLFFPLSYVFDFSWSDRSIIVGAPGLFFTVCFKKDLQVLFIRLQAKTFIMPFIMTGLCLGARTSLLSSKVVIRLLMPSEFLKLKMLVEGKEFTLYFLPGKGGGLRGWGMPRRQSCSISSGSKKCLQYKSRSIQSRF
jgi:hypothetical protein